MKIVSLLFFMVTTMFSVRSAESADTLCSRGDEICKKLERLSDTRQDEKIIQMADPAQHYSKTSLFYIGLAFMSAASKKAESSPDKAEQLYRRAIAFGHYEAYMGLYRLSVDKQPEIALGFVKQYVKTKPDDPDPFFILGEAEFQKNNYVPANAYLKKSKKLSTGHTTGLDWLLFQVNYILGNYKYASEALDSALAQGDFTEELTKLRKDPRFTGIEKNPEFKGSRGWFKNQ
jgi:tetratricopeptide (TPR) repeat protein